MRNIITSICLLMTLFLIIAFVPFSSAVEIVNDSEVTLLSTCNKQLSASELQTDTQTLVDILLANKYSYELIAMNSMQNIYRTLYLTYNIFPELETRTDSASILFNELIKLSNSTLDPTSANGVENRLNYVMLLSVLESDIYVQRLTIAEQTTLDELRNIDGTHQPFRNGQYGDYFYDAKLGIGYTATTTTLTRDGTEVPLYSASRELTQTQITEFNEYYSEHKPNATYYSAPSSTYNCHAYAWYSNTSSYWLADVELYLQDAHISEIFYDGYAEAGDIVVYYNADGTITHSAIITNNNNGELTCISKWGAAGTYIHNVNIIPDSYYAGLSAPDYDIFYLLNHNYSVYWYDTTTSHCYKCKYCDSKTINSHSFSISANSDGKTHSTKCAVCGYTITANHSYTVTANPGGSTHTKRCGSCGYSITETHILNLAHTQCLTCGYTGPFTSIMKKVAVAIE